MVDVDSLTTSIANLIFLIAAFALFLYDLVLVLVLTFGLWTGYSYRIRNFKHLKWVTNRTINVFSVLGIIIFGAILTYMISNFFYFSEFLGVSVYDTLGYIVSQWKTCLIISIASLGLDFFNIRFSFR